MTTQPASSPPGASPPGGDWHEPSDAELAGCWPDPFAGPPEDGDAWLDGVTAADLDALLGPGRDERQEAAEREYADAEFWAGGKDERLPPGPVLATLSQDVLDAGLTRLSDDELVGVLRASRRLSAWQNGVELAAVAQLDARRMRAAARPGSSRASEHVSAELAAALVLTGRSADLLLGLARDLSRLPAILAALLAGRIDRARAAIFASELAGLGDQAAKAVAMAFAGAAESMTTGQLRAALRAMVLYIDPRAAQRRAERGRADARVEAWQENSGNGALAGRELPPADAAAAGQRITAIARALQDAGAAGTLDQLRAAVFAALLAGRDLETLRPARAEGAAGRDDPANDGQDAARGCADSDSDAEADAADSGSSSSRAAEACSGSAASAGTGARPGGLAALTGSVHLTMPAAAWLGLSDAPGEAASLGPLDAWTCRDLARRLAAAGAATRWCVTLTGPDGRAAAHGCARGSPGSPGPPAPPAPPGPAGPAGPDAGAVRWLAGLRYAWLEHGTCTHARQVPAYRPPSLLRELVRTRQRTCSFPGCRRPARACDLDHTIPWDQDGLTCECNLAPLCRRHHRAKQAPGWHLAQPEPGVLTWTAPHGRSYTVTPEPYQT